MCITVSRRGMCLCDGRPCVTKCDQCEDGRVYVERVQGSEQHLEHLTKGEDIVISQDGYTLLCFASHCSSLLCSLILPQTLQSSGCILDLCLHFCFRASLPVISYSLSLHGQGIIVNHNSWLPRITYVLYSPTSFGSLQCKQGILFLNIQNSLHWK